jgi:energy-coupling factor transporter ATP-binding protein EcfA2
MKFYGSTNGYNGQTKSVFPNRDAKKFYSYVIPYKTLWAALIERLKIDKDCFVLLTGTTGSGKSSLTGKLNFQFAEKEPNFILNNGESMFIPEKHFIVDGDEFAYKMITEQGSSIWYDEAREGTNRQSWYDKINKAIKQRKNTNRKLFNIYWLCMPLESEFDPKLAAHLTMWIWVRRGVGEVYIANNQRKGGNGLDIDEIVKREEKWLRENPKKSIVPPIIHPEYVGRIFFSKMNKEEEKKYKELVKMKSATGKLTDEEMTKFGIEKEVRPKDIICASVAKIKTGEIQDKITLWNSLDAADLDDGQKLKMLNFYLKMEGWGTFDKLFKKDKKELW